MFTNSKNTRIIAIVTLTSTFVYYRFTNPSGSELQFTNNVVTFEQGSEQGSLNSIRDKEDLPSVQTDKPRGLVDRMTSDVIKTLNEDASGEDYSEYKPHRGNKEELDIIVVNNKVYRKNDTIPQKPFKFPVLKPSEGKAVREFDYNAGNFRSKDRKFLKEHAKELVRRAKKVAKVCNARSKLIESKDVRLVWDTKHTPNLLFCPIYKVASTSWMINFLRLAHFNEDNPAFKGMGAKKRERQRFRVKYGANQNKVFDLYPPPRDKTEFVKTFRNGLRVIIVRHPFTRILSAYRDKMTKLEPGPPEYKFRDLQLHIIAKYRPVDSPETSPFPTFAEFVQHILDSTKNYVTAEEWRQNVICWTPYWAHCNVCGADYNVILKLETIQEDERFLITLADLEELKELKAPEWRHLNNGTSSHDLTPKYFSQLSRIQVKQLYQRYLLDFLLFDYHIDDFDRGEEEE